MLRDRVTEATGELYAADPADFVPRRQALAATARDAGDKDAAKRIAALRKPTQAAWVVNRLARTDPSAPERLQALAASLRAAARAKDGRTLRDLSASRGELIDALTAAALAAAGIADPPAALREAVAATLTSALADPEVAGQFSAGTLTRAAQWAGFGLPLDPDLPDTDTPDMDGREADTPDTAAPEAAATPSPAPKPPAAAKPASSTRETPRRPAPRQTDQQPSGAQVAEEAAARRREAFHVAERSVATAVQATSAAQADEDRLETEVWDLEERLTRARSKLADARLRARRAEAAERKARQFLDRLPRPE